MSKSKPIVQAGDQTAKCDGSHVPARGKRFLHGGLLAAAAITFIFGFAAQVMAICSRPPDFDEHFHIQFMWLVSQGLAPDRDFLCPHPTAPFHLLGWLVGVLPQKPMLFIVLRLLSLLPLATLLILIGLIARQCGRNGLLAAAFACVVVATGQIPSTMEIRFDFMAWIFFYAAIYLILRGGGWKYTLAASACAVLSLFISPKHAFAFAPAILGYGIHLWLRQRPVFFRHALAAVGGLAAVLLGLTLIHPTAVPDSLRISMMNWSGQQQAVYEDSAMEMLGRLIKREPLLSLVLCVAPGLFFVRRAEAPQQVQFIYAGLFAGGLYLAATLPCGWTQYTSLVIAVFLLFTPWLLPRADARSNPRMPALIATVLVALSVFYVARNVERWDARRLMEELAIQDELQTICPPGETYVGAPSMHVWFRKTPAYVFIDDDPSWITHFGPERKHLFSAPYYYGQLEKQPPAFFCGVHMAATAKEYSIGAMNYLDRHINNYQHMIMPCQHLPGLAHPYFEFYLRKDLVPRARLAKPYDQR